MDISTRRGTAALVAAIAALTLVLALWATTSFGADSPQGASSSQPAQTQFVQQDDSEQQRPGRDCPEKDGDGANDGSSAPAPQATEEPQL